MKMKKCFVFRNYIKCIYFAVDCKLGPYKLGSCSATCGINAVRTKTRQVVQKAAYGGKDCQGKMKITENCGLIPCPSK